MSKLCGKGLMHIYNARLKSGSTHKFGSIKIHFVKQVSDPRIHLHFDTQKIHRQRTIGFEPGQCARTDNADLIRYIFFF